MDEARSLMSISNNIAMGSVLSSDGATIPLYLSKIHVKFDSELFAATSKPSDLSFKLQVFSSERDDVEEIPLEEIAPGRWGCNDDIKIVSEATFICKWDEYEDFGLTQITNSQLEKWRSNTSEATRIEQELVTDINGSVLKLSFNLSCERSDLSADPEIVRDDVDSFEDIEENEAYEEVFARFLERLDRSADNRKSLHEIGDTLLALFQQTKEKGPIHNCIEAYRFAVGITPPDDVDFLPFTYDTSMAYLARYELLGSENDLRGATKYMELCLSANTVEKGPRIKVLLLQRLAAAYVGRSERTGLVADLYQATSYLEKAHYLLPEDDDNMHFLLNSLGTAFSLSYTKTGNVVDINKAISYLQKSISLTPKGHPAMLDRLRSLSRSFTERYRATKNANDVWESTLCLQKIADITPDDDEEIVGMLYFLETRFASRFEKTGDVVNLSEAIAFAQRAIHLAPEGHEQVPALLNDLGYCLTSRFELNGDRSDIVEAISCLNRAVSLNAEGHMPAPLLLHNLGFALLRSYERPRWLDEVNSYASGNRTQLFAAIEILQKGVGSTPEFDGTMPMLLNTLGVALLRRFELQGDVEDLNQAISLQRRAVNLTIEEDLDMTLRLTNLGLSLQQRYRKVGNIMDISEAISYQQRAVGLVPDGHPNKSLMLDNLGDSLAARSQDSKGDPVDVEAAISNYASATTSPAVQPSLQLAAAKKWSKLAQKFGRADVLDAYTVAMRLIPRAVGLDKPIRKRHANLEQDVSKLSVQAATAALSFGRYDLALEWLEQGRCLVWNQIHNLRTPLDPRIRLFDPALADAIEQTSLALESDGFRAEPRFGDTVADKMAIQIKVTEHLKRSHEWDLLLARVRNIPGLEDFLHETSSSSLLRDLPRSGIVVIINVHDERCDALALLYGSSVPLHIPLPSFSQRKAENLRRNLKAHLQASGRTVREAERDSETDLPDIRGMRLHTGGTGGVKGILKELWICVVRPILDGLAFQNEPPSELQRIWWCATGSLAFLPIHAAGIYDGPPDVASNLGEFAISSYTPTIQALVERVKNSRLRATERKQNKLFMVCQPDTPRQVPLPGTKKEVRAIECLLKDHDMPFLSLESADATIDKAMENMKTHGLIHFACHASQNTVEPLKSGFHLYNGKLELSSIIQKQLQDADFAFLSACQTSTGDEKLSEEAVHLAAGMLAAGYQGSVATMWSISDYYAPQIAEDFYAHLIEGQDALKGDNAARALHHAIQKLRKTLGDSESALLVWVPYVHFGL